MRKFVFYISSEKSQRNLPSTIREMIVYKISKNSLLSCGNVIINTGSYKGNESEIMNHLSRNGFLPKVYKDGYYKRDNGKFMIEQI